MCRIQTLFYVERMNECCLESLVIKSYDFTRGRFYCLSRKTVFGLSKLSSIPFHEQFDCANCATEVPGVLIFGAVKCLKEIKSRFWLTLKMHFCCTPFFTEISCQIVILVRFQMIQIGVFGADSFILLVLYDLSKSLIKIVWLIKITIWHVIRNFGEDRMHQKCIF